ncbi:hypothetical protein PF005_g4775 [Phytophthora fragariae]|uniref:Uncharacterized protein n=1 Tax=Phytophthora fragariae TaxID=53985 RepID=A0A6A3YZK2_9STRA|nr:hypothetical protein PF003_g2349 [Phytophthora fragariae]KAE8945225.1 hypothetical protein PF009_g5100 [Phytophthora fragariae]KAE9023757.1 hypothetical protein PF011_g3820 [Phytophthora fragariae]KAE9123670.1 hypothetical protein PF007_g6966 [Phytophthora fragariae]KAE9129717.1 hypothetical protein PF010_g4087 [Phytophthora fragariae]
MAANVADLSGVMALAVAFPPCPWGACHSDLCSLLERSDHYQRTVLASISTCFHCF